MMGKKLKILHFIHWPVSGITSMVKSLINRPSMQEFDHYIILCEGQDKHISYFENLIKGGEVISPKNSIYFNLTKVPKILSQWQPDLIHTHSFQPSLWAVILRRKQIPHLRTIHSSYPYLSDYSYSAKLKRLLEYWLLTRTNTRVVAVSSETSKLVEEVYQLSVHTLFNGIDHEAIIQKKNECPDNAMEKKLFVKRKGCQVIVSCGRLHQQKGFDLLLQAFYRLKKEHKDLILWLIGDGHQRSELAMEIKRLGLTDQVFLLGHQDNPYWYLSQSDIYVASSRYEGFGLALLEAMRLGLPVVASPESAAPLSLNSDVAVCLSTLSINEIEAGIRLLLSSPELKKKLHKTAPIFTQRYSIDKTAEGYVQQYKYLLKNRL